MRFRLENHLISKPPNLMKAYGSPEDKGLQTAIIRILVGSFLHQNHNHCGAYEFEGNAIGLCGKLFRGCSVICGEVLTVSWAIQVVRKSYFNHVLIKRIIVGIEMTL